MDELISKEQALKVVADYQGGSVNKVVAKELLEALPEAVVRCKDCIHFELDKPYIIQGVPVLGHEVCNAWSDGCKTDQNGYCFMAERRTDG